MVDSSQSELRGHVPLGSHPGSAITTLGSCGSHSVSPPLSTSAPTVLASQSSDLRAATAPATQDQVLAPETLHSQHPFLPLHQSWDYNQEAAGLPHPGHCASAGRTPSARPALLATASRLSHTPLPPPGWPRTGCKQFCFFSNRLAAPQGGDRGQHSEY